MYLRDQQQPTHREYVVSNLCYTQQTTNHCPMSKLLTEIVRDNANNTFLLYVEKFTRTGDFAQLFQHTAHDGENRYATFAGNLLNSAAQFYA